MRSTVVEQDFCGSGASGRKGGFALSWWAKLPTLLRLAKASEEGLDEIEAFCRRHAIDAHFTRGGWLWTATTDSQRGSWNATVRAAEEPGVGPWRNLSAQEVAARSGTHAHLEGVLDTSAATVQPAALVLGLRRVAIEAGVRLYEQSPVSISAAARPPSS